MDAPFHILCFLLLRLRLNVISCLLLHIIARFSHKLPFREIVAILSVSLLTPKLLLLHSLLPTSELLPKVKIKVRPTPPPFNSFGGLVLNVVQYIERPTYLTFRAHFPRVLLSAPPSPRLLQGTTPLKTPPTWTH